MAEYWGFDAFDAEEAPADNGEVTWGDYGELAKAGTKDIGSWAGAAMRAAGEGSDNPHAKFAAVLGRYLNEELRASADQDVAELSPEARRRFEAAVTSEEFWSNPVSATMLKGTRMAPSVAAAALPATLFSGAIGTTLGVAAVSGSLSAAQTVDELYAQTDSLSDEELQTQSPYYAELRAVGMDEDSARAEFNSVHRGMRPALVGIVGAMTGMFGPAAQVARGVKGVGAAVSARGRGRLARAGAGLAEGATAEAIEEGTQNVVAQDAAMDSGFQEDFDPEQFLASVGEGALLGGVFGGAAAGVSRGRRSPAPPIEEVDPIAPTAEQTVALTAKLPATEPVTEPVIAPATAQPVAQPTMEVTSGSAPVSDVAPVEPEGGAQLGAPPEVQAASQRLAAATTAAPVTQEVTKPARTLTEEEAKAFPKSAALLNEIETQRGAPGAVTAASGRLAAVQPRVLEDVRPEAKANVKALNKQVQENLKATEPKVPGKKHRTKAEVAKLEKDAGAAKALFEKHAPEDTSIPTTPAERAALKSRLDLIVQEADAAGIQVPTKVAGRADHIVWLREVKTLAKKMGQKSFVGARAREHIETFLIRERAAKSGDFEVMRSERRAEGEAAKRVTQGEVEKKADVAAPVPEPDVEAAPEGTTEADYKPEAADAAPAIAKSAKGAARVDDQTEVATVKTTEGKEVEVERAKAASGVRKVELTDDVKRAALEAYERAQKKAQSEAPTNAEVNRAAAKTDTEPTEAQKKSGRYEKGSVDFRPGLRVSIENPRGSTRRGKDKGGKEWSVKMPDHYGYIQRTEGADGDHVDVYLGKNPKSEFVFIIDQVDPDTRKFDEHKVMLGYETLREAANSYEKAFSDGRGIERIGDVKMMSVDEFKAWLKQGDTTAPVGEPDAALRPAKRGSAGFADEVSDADYYAGAAVRASNVRRAAEHIRGNIKEMGLSRNRYHKAAQVGWRILLNRLIDRVGDVPIYIVPDHAYRHADPDSRGFYDAIEDYIVIKESVVDAGDLNAAHTFIHEMVHAAFMKAVHASDESLKNQLNSLYLAAYTEAAKLGNTDVYGLSNLDEFIAEALSNPKFQEFLAFVPAPPELVTRLRLDNSVKSLWDTMLAVIRRALSLPPVTGSVLHGVVRIADNLSSGPVGPLNAAEQRSVWQWMGIVEGNKQDFESVRPDDLLAAISGGLTTPAMRGVEPALSNNYGPHVERAREQIGDFSSAFAAWASRMAVRAMTGDQLRQQYAGLFVDGQGDALQDLWKAIAAQQPVLIEAREAYERLAQRFLDFSKANPKAAQEFAELGIEARMAEVNLVDGVAPDDIVAHSSNAHLGKDATNGWQGKKRLPDMQRRFLTLPPEARKLWTEMTAYYRDTHNEMVRGSVEALLDPEILKVQLSPQEIAALTQRVMDQKLTDADKEALGHTLFHHLQRAREFHRVRGTYFPLMRYGDHVVETTDKVTNTGGGKLVEPDVVLFKDKSDKKARDAARVFAEGTDLVVLGVRKVYFNALTGEQVSHDASKSLNDVEVGYRVRLQTKGVYFFESRAAAEKFARENPEGHDSVSPPQDRIGEGYHPHLLTGTQMSSILKSIDARTDVAASSKKLMRTVLSQSAARMMSGNRISSRRLKSRKITGASDDFARNLLQYGSAAARHLATAKFMPKVRSALHRMQKAMERYEGKDKNDLVQAFNETTKRVDEGTIEPNEPSKVMKDLFALSFLARLGSIGYSVINATQVMMVTAPTLAGRYGGARAYSALTRAYNDIGLGEQLVAGVANTARATKQFKNAGLLGTDDILGNVRKHIARLEDGTNLARMFDALIEGNAISLSAGFEISEAVAEGRGKWGSTLAKADRIARQLPVAIEVINRSVSAIAAYRLAVAGKMSHEKAVQYAFDVTKNTQGDYSAANAPRFFNNPYMRPALQFKKYAQLMTYLLADMAHRAFAGATREERAVARRQLGYVMATQIAMAGSLSLPGLELVKVAFLISSALGLTEGWDEQEERLRRLADETFGKTWGELLTRGVVSRAANVNLSTRLSLADLWLFGEPKTDDAEGVAAYGFRLIGGSAGSLVLEYGQAMRAAAEGDFAKAAERVFPIKTVSDAVKAANRYQKGNQTEYELLLNTIGLQSGRQAEQSRAVGVAIRRRDRIDAEYKRLSKAYMDAATPAELARLRVEIVKHNKSAPLRYKVFPGALDKARERRKQERVN